MRQDLNIDRLGESLIEIGRELYREGAANSNVPALYLLVSIQGITSSSESEDLWDLVGV